QPLLDAYSDETGVEFQVLHAPKGLAQRLQAEGALSPADLILTVDIARLSEVARLNLLAPTTSPTLAANVPANLRAKDNTWYALSTRARVVITSADRVPGNAITRMEDLALPKWRGKICTRIGSHVYNRALLASLVAHLGEAEAQNWAAGLVANMARKPQGNDRAQARAIYAGACDIALINTYYYGLMQFNQAETDQQDWAKAVRLNFLNQAPGDRGQHINISGAGIVKTSRNQAEAKKFLEWLTEPKAQRLYASINFEYPVNPQVAIDDRVSAWGGFRADDLPIEDIAKHSPTAQRIIDRTGW
ncbi:MAG: extracellular solute-binding protein, partial [Proteobacteria bacterium]|nr:extracellular solute-binding protein [Pseudomonadota bacterium]